MFLLSIYIVSVKLAPHFSFKNQFYKEEIKSKFISYTLNNKYYKLMWLSVMIILFIINQ